MSPRSTYPAQSKTFTHQRDAEAWARKIESEMERGLWLDTKEGEKLTLGEALSQWEKEELPHLAESSQQTEKRRFKHIKGYKVTITTCRRRTAINSGGKVYH